VKNEPLFQQFLDAIPQIIWTARPDGSVDHVNTTLNGYSGVDLRSGGKKSWIASVHPDDVPGCRQAWEASVRHGTPYAVEVRILRQADRTYRWHLVHATPTRAASGAILKWYGTAIDIHERKVVEQETSTLATSLSATLVSIREAHEAILISQERFESIAKATADAVWDWDLVSDHVWWSQGYATLFGHPLSPTQDDKMDSWTRKIHPDDKVRVLGGINAVIQGSANSWNDEYRFRRTDGSYADVIDRGYVLRDSTGKGVRMVGGMSDESERKHSSDSLARVNRALRVSSACNQALLHARDEPALLNEICRIAVNVGGYRMAWVGYAENDTRRAVVPMASAGFGNFPEYVRKLDISWSEHAPRGCGPSGTSIRTGRVIVSADIASDPAMANWAEAAAENELRGLIALPLQTDGVAFGVLSLYSTIPLEVTDEETSLLQDLADNLAFGIQSLRMRREKEAIEEAVSKVSAELREQASLLDKTLDVIIVCDLAHHVLFWNRGAERLYGWTSAEALGKVKSELLHSEPIENQAAIAAILVQDEWSGQLLYHRKDGTAVPVEAHWSLVRDDQGRPQSIFTINRDITQRKADELEIEKLAFFDTLTGLPNRRLLHDRLGKALVDNVRSREIGALLFIDLDNFKSLNDTVGHDKGDLLLQQVALRLQSCIRKSNTVARLGGDEFVIVLEHLGKQDIEAAALAECVAEKVLGSFRQPFQLSGVEHHSTPSIGIALFCGDSNSVDELLKRADLAMYQAKAAGRNTIRFFDPGMQKTINARVALESDIRDGLQRRAFTLSYQAQSDRDGRWIGTEALLRWRHPTRGDVAPSEFIPLAEDTGQILLLGEWVLETACAQLAKWASRPEEARLSIAINVSARQFRRPEFVKQVVNALARSGANPNLLKLELTESLLIEDLEGTVLKMHALKADGVTFSLDDFGTGYSSLAYLKRLPLDQLKIDQSFVRDMLTNPNDAAIAKTIVTLGQSLGLTVVAEGVETEAQRDFLAAAGCDTYQGYLYSKPLPVAQFESAMELNCALTSR